MTRTARATLILVAVNLTIYFLMLVCWLVRELFPNLPETMTGCLALGASFGELSHAPWTLVTYMFTHLNFVHLTVNMLWLIGFGPMIKGDWQHTIATYLVGGVCGAIAYLATSINTNNHIELAGASASVLAVIVATACLAPNRQLNMIILGAVKLKWLALIAVITIFFDGDLLSPVTVAHLGGAIAGGIIGLSLHYHDYKLSQQALETARRHTRRQWLLHKVDQSGFASLSEVERLELFDMRNRH